CLGNPMDRGAWIQSLVGKPTSCKLHDTKVVFVATFSCLSLFLLFLAIFYIYRCTQQDSSQEESTKRTSRSVVRKQRDADAPTLERISESPEEPEGVTYAQLNTTVLSAAASVPTEETPSSCDYTTVKV
ncbi:hypothetical protein FD754_014646, partial [Muntiacus muntjak]